jgi:hypothetical protein
MIPGKKTRGRSFALPTWLLTCIILLSCWLFWKNLSEVIIHTSAEQTPGTISFFSSLLILLTLSFSVRTLLRKLL